MRPFVERAGSGRDRVLDGLRAVAVLVVICGHALLFRIPGLPQSITKAAASMAVTGVEIFFLISGYVITLLLLAEGSVDLKAFYVRRITRIIPPFYTYLATVIILSLLGYISMPEWAQSAAFLCNVNNNCHWFVGHSWSLAVEEQFYLVWPTLFVLLAAKRLPFLVAIVAGLLALSIARGFVPFANNVSFLYIAIGALVACSNRLQSWIVGNIRTAAWFTLVVALPFVILFLPDMLKPVLLALLVFGAANVPLAKWLLESTVFQWVGKISYSLYLWQELFLGRPQSYHGAPPLILLLPLVAYLSWRFIEKPGMALGRSYSRHRKGRVVRPDYASAVGEADIDLAVNVR